MNKQFSFSLPLLFAGIVAFAVVSCGPSNSVNTSSHHGEKDRTLVWVATNHDDLNAGLRSFSIDPETGSLELVEENTEIPKVSFFDINPDQSFLYAVYSTKEGGMLGTFSMEGNGRLKLQNELPIGRGPCYVSNTSDGKHVLVAHYSGGDVRVFHVAENGIPNDLAPQIILHQGSSVNPDRQEGPHPHMILPTPNAKYVFVPDLGTDQLMAYSWNGIALEPAEVPFVRFFPGSGPRHFDIHKELKIAYVLDELLSRVTSVKLADDYALIDTIATYPLLPEDFTEFNKSSDIHLSPDGKFLYAANRGHNSLTIFKVWEDGALQFIAREPTRGKYPRNFAISPDGKFLLVGNRNSDNLLVFGIDSDTGLLSLVHEYRGLPGILCIKFQEA